MNLKNLIPKDAKEFLYDVVLIIILAFFIHIADDIGDAIVLSFCIVGLARNGIFG